jgi:prepilin-type N-terminal cleavage/methylation domain-containing protein
MIKNRFRGFTLIELLVVIAIIGILSAVVLASLNTARNKGGDAAVQSNLDGIRSQAELVASSNGNSYATVCSDATVNNGFNAAAAAGGATGTTTTLTTAQTAGTGVCHSSASGYVVSVPLKSNSAVYWCIDSTGNGKQDSSLVAASAIVCP